VGVHLILAGARGLAAFGEIHRLKSVLLEAYSHFVSNAKIGSKCVPARIEVEQLNASRFRVHVIEAGSESTHEVTLDPKDCARLAGGAVEPEELIRESFQFLLEREPKESILSRFDLSIISRYFPEYEREIKKRLL
jgi:hypothetical protein